MLLAAPAAAAAPSSADAAAAKGGDDNSGKFSGLLNRGERIIIANSDFNGADSGGEEVQQLPIGEGESLEECAELPGTGKMGGSPIRLAGEGAGRSGEGGEESPTAGVK
uniref:Uncharacterized protein n=1 Tax=Heterosigma akashiwo TaxID=2829 RepID=A0A7S3XWH7_HETAK